MAYQRKRRSAVPQPPVDDESDRVYTEEDYAAPEPPDEWDAPPAYLPAEDPEQPGGDEAFAPDEDESWPREDWSADPFSVPGHDYAFQGDPLEDDDLLDEDDLDDDLLTDEDRAELRRSNWKLLAGLADFAGVILGTAAILVTVALLVSLLNWLIADVSQSFVLLQKNF